MFPPPPQTDSLPVWRQWVSRFYDYFTGAIDIDGSVTFSKDIVVPTKTPSSASDTGTAGTITWDSDYIYICTATDTWKRVAISTW